MTNTLFETSAIQHEVVVEILSVLEESFALCPCLLWNEANTSQGECATSSDLLKSLRKQKTSEKLSLQRKRMGLMRLWEGIHIKQCE